MIWTTLCRNNGRLYIRFYRSDLWKSRRTGTNRIHGTRWRYLGNRKYIPLDGTETFIFPLPDWNWEYQLGDRGHAHECVWIGHKKGSREVHHSCGVMDVYQPYHIPCGQVPHQYKLPQQEGPRRFLTGKAFNSRVCSTHLHNGRNQRWPGDPRERW